MFQEENNVMDFRFEVAVEEVRSDEGRMVKFFQDLKILLQYLSKFNIIYEYFWNGS